VPYHVTVLIVAVSPCFAIREARYSADDELQRARSMCYERARSSRGKAVHPWLLTPLPVHAIERIRRVRGFAMP
jgi:hypothetical protein